jgi:hypothetical protein
MIHECSRCGKEFRCTEHCAGNKFAKECRCDPCELIMFPYLSKDCSSFKYRCKSSYVLPLKERTAKFIGGKRVCQ